VTVTASLRAARWVNWRFAVRVCPAVRVTVRVTGAKEGAEAVRVQAPEASCGKAKAPVAFEVARWAWISRVAFGTGLPCGSRRRPVRLGPAARSGRAADNRTTAQVEERFTFDFLVARLALP